MANIAIVPDRVTSKFIYSAELARRLQDAGHRVTLIGPIEDRLNPDWPDAHEVDLKIRVSTSEPVGGTGILTKADRFLSRATKRRSRIREAVQSVGEEQFLELIQSLQPSLLLIDIEAHEYTIPAIHSGVPVALLSPFYCLEKRPGVPPLSTGIVPGKGWKGCRLVIEWAWFKFRLWKWYSQAKKFLRAAGADRLSLLKSYARHHQVSFRRYMTCSEWLIPFNYRSIPIVNLTALEMEFVHAPAPHVYHAGPIISHDRSAFLAYEAAETFDRKLEELLEVHSPKQRSRRLILCSFGSFYSGDDKGFWKKLCIVASKRPSWDMVFALGARIKAGELPSLPANAYCCEWAPQMRILAAADCAVIHGGPATIHECIHYQVPTVVYPFDVNDQRGMAARVEYHSLGIVGDRLRDDPSTIIARVEETMTSRTVSAALSRMHDVFDRYENDGRAVKTIESLLPNPVVTS